MINTETALQIVRQTDELLVSSIFRNFVAQSHSRYVLERMNADSSEWPSYSLTLSTNLLYIGHLLLWQGLRLREAVDWRDKSSQYLKQGAEILEFVFAKADAPSPERLEQLFTAALGYYIAGYSARAHVLIRDLGTFDRLLPEYELLRRLFLRQFSGIRQLIFDVLNSSATEDLFIATALRSNEINEDEAIDRILRASFHRAFSFFVEYPKSGRSDLLEQSRELLNQGIELAQQSRLVDWWWLYYCARYLFDEFQTNSLWNQVGPMDQDDPDHRFVKPYIRTAYGAPSSITELWPSQVFALPKINQQGRPNYCLKMPTSAGKTRIAELAILRFLIDHKDDPTAKCLYIAPFRSLAIEVERALRQSFHSLGVNVSELYGGFELSPTESMLIERTSVVIATPEKADAFIRYNSDFADTIKLIIVDEGHIISPNERGLRFEFFLHRIILRYSDLARILFMSAVLPNTNQFAKWIAGDSSKIIEHDWRPSRLMVGDLRWNGKVGSIYYTHVGQTRLEHDCFIRSFIHPMTKAEMKGSRKQKSYPSNIQELISDAALLFARQEMTLLFVPQKRSVETAARDVMEALRLRSVWAANRGESFGLPIAEEGRALLNECVQIATETMGNDAEIIRYIESGFVIHHADLPHRLRIRLEELIRKEVIKLVIATTTLAQGVNLPIKTVLVRGLQQDQHETISSATFWNICGRAGRGMKENEGQVLFAVDETAEIFKQERQESLKNEYINGYASFHLKSALLQVLDYVSRRWEEVHPNIDIASLCEHLAENNLAWALDVYHENLAGWLDLLDEQLIALTEEQESEVVSPDQLQVLFQKSLLFLQYDDEIDGKDKIENATRLMFARLQSLNRRFPTRALRNQVYRLGFPPSDCMLIIQKTDELSALFQQGADYMQWQPEERCAYLVTIVGSLLALDTMQPDTVWQDKWQAILTDWLMGLTANEMVTDHQKPTFGDSAATISTFIDNLFGYRLPWGMNAVTYYLKEIADSGGQEYPPIVRYFAELVKYGVHDPIASILIAFGRVSRQIALTLAIYCPISRFEPSPVVKWFLSLKLDDLEGFALDFDAQLAIMVAQVECERMMRAQPRENRSWQLSAKVEEKTDKVQLLPNDVLTFALEPAKNEITFYTLMGHEVGHSKFSGPAPNIWTNSERIECVIQNLVDGNMNVLMREV